MCYPPRYEVYGLDMSTWNAHPTFRRRRIARSRHAYIAGLAAAAAKLSAVAVHECTETGKREDPKLLTGNHPLT